MIFAKNFARNLKKNKILGTSDACSMSRLSQGATKPAYYIVDCRIYRLLAEAVGPNGRLLSSFNFFNL